MNVTRLWAVISALLVVVVGAFGYFVGIQPQLDAASKADQARSSVEDQNAIYEITLARLRAEAENLPELQAALAEARVSIPAKANLSTFLQQLSDLASAAGVTVASVTTADALGFVAAPEFVDAVPGAITQEQFVVIPVQMEVVGPRANVLDFIERVQTGGRLVLVTDLRLDRDGDDLEIARGSLSGLIYVLLEDPGASANDAVDDSQEAAGDN